MFYCPKCSNNSFEKLDSKKFWCSNCDFTFYKNPCSAVAAIIEYNGQIIMTRRGKQPAKGKLDLPGGFVDENETLEESLIREVHEELSININELSYLCSFPNIYPYKGVEYFTVDSFFMCKTESLNIISEEKEIEEWKLIDPKKLNIEEIAFSSVIKALKKYLQIID